VTYAALETSKASGSPVELYEFRRGGDFWRYTSAAVAIAFQSKTYEPLALDRTSLDMSGEMGRANLSVTMPRDAPVADGFRVSPPSDVMTLAVYRQHVGDSEYVVVWLGRVLNAAWSAGQVELHCEPVYTSLKRNGLRRHYQRSCPHTLYSTDCGVTQDTYRVNGTVTAISGLDVDAAAFAAFAADYFKGGFLEWDGPANTERRMILSSSGTTVSLAAAPLNLVGGQSVRAYPGCDHSLGAGGCAKFSNTVNYGGFPYIPLKNPFNAAIY